MNRRSIQVELYGGPIKLEDGYAGYALCLTYTVSTTETFSIQMLYSNLQFGIANVIRIFSNTLCHEASKSYSIPFTVHFLHQ